MNSRFRNTRAASILLLFVFCLIPVEAATRIVAWGAGSTNSGTYPDLGQSIVPDGLTNAIAIAASEAHSLCLNADGTVVAWGDDSVGQTDVPPGLSNVSAIGCGTKHSLALKSDGTVVAWGAHVGGCCGVWPVNVPGGISNVVAVAGGAAHTLALMSRRDSACLGRLRSFWPN
jgi:alpha-tubulin suppressor-like RCC1 family protein